MKNNDYVVRLKKFAKDVVTGETDKLNWVIFPLSNRLAPPSVIRNFNELASYKAGSFIVRNGVIFRAALNVKPGAWNEDEWENADKMESFIGLHNPSRTYGVDEIVYDADEVLWYTTTSVGPGPFDQTQWMRLIPEDPIETASVYIDPNSSTEAETVIRGVFVDIEKPVLDLASIVSSFYDASTKSSLFQDSAGTMPVTEAGQKVGLIKDQVGTLDIQIPDADRPTYMEDDHGLGYLVPQADVDLQVIDADAMGPATLLSSVPNVGVVKTGNGSLATGLPLKSSVHNTIPLTQFVIMPPFVTTDDSNKVIDELKRFSNRYSNDVCTSLDYMFASALSGAGFEGETSLRFIKSIDYMFKDGGILTAHHMTMDVSDVESFVGTFSGIVTNADISLWDMSSAIYVQDMFANNPSFDAAFPNLRLPKVIDASGMFENAASFNQDVSALGLDSCVYAMSMFKGTAAFDQDISAMEFPSLVSATEMFSGAVVFNQPTTFKAPKLSSATRMFENCNALNSPVRIESLILTNIESMFDGCDTFDATVTFDSMDIVNAESAFRDCVALNSMVNINLGKAVNVKTMFKGCTLLDQDLQLDASGVTYTDEMFADCVAQTVNPFSSLLFSSVEEAPEMFARCTALNIDGELVFYRAININSLFEGCTGLNGSIHLTAYGAKETKFIFKGCTSLNATLEVSLPLTLSIEGLFQDCSSLDSPLIVTAPRLTSVKEMFRDTVLFNSSLVLDTSLIQDFTGMFQGAAAFNQDISLSFVSAVSITDMFREAAAFNLPLTDIELNHIVNMDGFLAEATSFDQDISAICVSNHPIQPTDFITSSVPIFSETAKQPLWGAAC